LDLYGDLQKSSEGMRKWEGIHLLFFAFWVALKKLT